jgi:alpha-D-ribose 1-methylphosphonate 5-triphosphate synthase subunit PhnL
VLVIAFSGFVFNRFRVTQKQKVIIEKQKVLVDEAYAQLEEKNKEVMDSIHYAKRIQTALMPNEKFIDRTLNKLNKS